VGNIHSVAGRLPPWPPGAQSFGVILILRCSARGCANAASWALRWNNPKLHAPDRRKTWLACEAHRESLGSFLSVRGFLRDTVPVGELDERD
jgi:hypothetical protein